jgi:hypothetical protein
MAEQWQVQYFLMKEKIKQLKGQQRVMEVRYLVEEAKRKQAEYEERYNHYHDPHNGRFASGGGAGGGNGLYYSQGKGKGFIVGSASQYISPEAAQKALALKKATVAGAGKLLFKNSKDEFEEIDTIHAKSKGVYKDSYSKEVTSLMKLSDDVLQERLSEVQRQIDDNYWRFTRSAHSKSGSAMTAMTKSGEEKEALKKAISAKKVRSQLYNEHG